MGLTQSKRETELTLLIPALAFDHSTMKVETGVIWLGRVRKRRQETRAQGSQSEGS